jgi:hypothetical protein
MDSGLDNRSPTKRGVQTGEPVIFWCGTFGKDGQVRLLWPDAPHTPQTIELFVRVPTILRQARHRVKGREQEQEKLAKRSYSNFSRKLLN